MAQNPKYDNDMVNLGYLNKRLGQTEESINKNNNSISQLPKNYSTPPNPPYYKDSLLCYGNKIYRCNTTKLKGEFSWNDWTIVATDDTTLSDFVKNTYELDKLEIQEQIDGKIQTYYQENDPSKDWVTDLDKGRHIGDYWYNTTNDTQWRYNRIITGSTITYGWGQVNIPKAVFDTIDSKKSIYTEKPTSYQKDDLWIIEEWILDEDLPIGTDENPIARGDWVFSVANSDTYNKEHWVKRDEDISMTYIKQHYYTIGEIDSSFEEIERNTDSKITKAKDEISLSVEQTYTTKEEHKATIYDFDEKIGTINQTITEHKETISDLSIEVGEITSTVESIETTTKNLEIDIDGVSADFEEFKDNEYIQSIDNLQKQIDGAIQFWNGAEIPTVNNYPANEWTTEKDKINHQADIYTVVQDVQGEMKQGKSYRFDKIDGVWQWIELTDNELSAVQAIAQEALNKANTNADEIGIVKTRVSTLEQTDEQIKASVESIDKQIIPTANISGSNIYVEDASDNPLVKLEIEGKSKQETRSGRNLYNYKDTNQVTSGVTVDNDGWITINYDNSSGTSAKYFNYYVNKREDLKLNTKYNVITEIKNVTGNAYLFPLSYSSRAQLSYDKFYNFSKISNGDVLQILINSSSDFSNTDIFTRTFVAYEPSTYGNITFRISVLEDTTVTTDAFEYEPYGISPSPDFPSEIESVGYTNLLNKDSVTSGYRLGSDGTPFGADGYWLSDFIKVQSSTQYIYKRKAKNDSQAYAFYDENKNFISRKFMSNSTLIYISTTSTTKYMRITDLNDSLEIAQLEKGLILHNNVSYGKYVVEVETIGKNLFDKNNATTQVGFFSADGTLNGGGSSTVTTSYIKIIPNTDFTISGFVVNRIVYYDENFNFIERSDTISNTPYTFNKNAHYIRIQGVTEKFDLNKLQLEEGSVATEYTPYQERITTMQLNAPLRSLPNGVEDIAYIKNNKLYVDRYVGSVVLDGSENWYFNKMVNNYGYYTEISDAKTVDNTTISAENILCSHYIVTRPDWQWNSVAGSINCALNTGSKPTVRFANGEATNELEEFKTWLSTHNTQVDYELGEPYTEELGEIQMPSTFKGVNHISTTDKLEPTLNIEYVRDTTLSNYVEGQINKVMTIEERHYSKLVIEDNSIKANVTEINSNISEMTEDIHTVQETLTSTEKTLEVISTNIDKTTGEIREVTTINGYKFNKDGLNIYTNENSFNTLIDNEGTYYKDGDAIISETTKDGFMATSIKNKGSEEYCYDESNKVYDFVKERIEVDGEYGYATFYNGVN